MSSKVTLEGLENITIIGHSNSTTVQCNDIGAVKFVAGNNLTIEHIKWERCGSNSESTYPGIEFYSLSEVTLQNCYFYNSTGPAVVLSNISGIVYIENCHFTHTNKYRGHGVALYYFSSTNNHNQTMIVIDNSRFAFHRTASSMVYIDASNYKFPSNVDLQNIAFINNEGVPIYISNTRLHLSGSVLFKWNEADNDGGSTSSTVIFNDKCNACFSDNSATYYGGATYLST